MPNTEKLGCLLSTPILRWPVAQRSPKIHRTAKDGLEEHFQCIWYNARFSFCAEDLLEREGCFFGSGRCACHMEVYTKEAGCLTYALLFITLLQD